jgi:hypothetical protein
MIKPEHSRRFRADMRALIVMLGVIVLAGLGFRLTKVRLFAAVLYLALGLYVIRFSRLTYRDPDETYGAWPSHFWFLREGSIGSRRFLRGCPYSGSFWARLSWCLRRPCGSH